MTDVHIDLVQSTGVFCWQTLNVDFLYGLKREGKQIVIVLYHEVFLLFLIICTYPYAGLINEIMSKGRRMTYEELCNAVLPVLSIMSFLGISNFHLHVW